MISTQSRLILELFSIVLFVIAFSLLNAPFPTRATAGSIQKDDARARELFVSIVPVLKHPRCLNCHSAGDFARQGDDGHIHTQNVRRGLYGFGKYGQKCNACHQEKNVPGPNMPPGAPNWQLPPADLPMIWEDKTAGQICRQMKDPKQNNGKTIAQIVQHVTADKLVMWGWNPGEGRTLPPMDHAEFARRFKDWASYGAACPE